MAKIKEKKSAETDERLSWWIGKFARARFWYMASRVDVRILNALNVFLHSAISMIILGVAARITSWPLIFPSLGPTIFLLFYTPSSPMAAPRNAVTSHLFGALTGWLSHMALVWLVPAAGYAPLTHPAMIVTAAMALAICGIFMSLTDIVHPPAASTTLIASLGLMKGPLTIIMVGTAVFLLCMQAWTMHRLAGIRYPIWFPAAAHTGPDIETKLGKLAGRPGGEKENPVKDVAALLASRQKLK